MFVRRRPLARAAMLGGTAYVAHRAGERRAMDDAEQADQEARLAALEAQQQAAAMPPPMAAPVPAAAPAAGGDMVGRLQQLAQLRDQGVLTPEEFEAAKQKVLTG
jgi:hypothetical protein